MRKKCLKVAAIISSILCVVGIVMIIIADILLRQFDEFDMIPILVVGFSCYLLWKQYFEIEKTSDDRTL